MKKVLKSFIIGLVFLSSLTLLSYADTITGLIDEFKQATDLKRQQLQSEYFAKSISASGVVSNVEDYNYFDEKKSLTSKFYRVTTGEQKTANNTPYQIVFLAKDFNSVKDLKKGQTLEKEGKIIKILDERLQISVWLYDGELTPEDKEMFAQ